MKEPSKAEQLLFSAERRCHNTHRSKAARYDDLLSTVREVLMMLQREREEEEQAT